MQSFSHDSITNESDEETSSRLSRVSEANASETRDNIDDMFILYYIYSDVLQSQNSVLFVYAKGLIKI